MKKKFETLLRCLYYMNASKNTKAKLKIDSTELRMEFYFNILHACAVPNENVLWIYVEAKL